MHLMCLKNPYRHRSMKKKTFELFCFLEIYTCGEIEPINYFICRTKEGLTPTEANVMCFSDPFFIIIFSCINNLSTCVYNIVSSA